MKPATQKVNTSAVIILVVVLIVFVLALLACRATPDETPPQTQASVRVYDLITTPLVIKKASSDIIEAGTSTASLDRGFPYHGLIRLFLLSPRVSSAGGLFCDGPRLLDRFGGASG
jgi:hypothetical protein